MLCILGSLVGAVLGMRFKVLSLVPVTVVGWVYIAIVAVALNQHAQSAFFSMILLSASLQVGYLSGLGLRNVMIAARAQRVRPVTVSTSTSALRPNR